MNSRRPFSKLKGKPHSTSSTGISFRFNPLDEELEEISLDKKESSPMPDDKNSETESIGEPSTSSIHTECFEEANGVSEKSENSELTRVENIDNTATDENLEPPVKETVKGYLSRFGRMACSLDSEPESVVEGEGWPFLNDFTGRITKNLEECIHKDIKGFITEGEIVEGVPCLKEAKNTGKSSFASSDRASPSPDHSDHISPSVEVTESLEEADFMQCLTGNSAENVLSENDNTKESVEISQPKIKPVSSAFNMTLSSLMATRSSSFDDDHLESKSPVKQVSKQSAVITKGSTSPPSSTPKLEMSSKVRKRNGSLLNVFLHTCSYYRLIMSMWNRTVSCILVAVIACLLAPIPSLMSGFLVGVILSSTTMYWLIQPTAVREQFSLPDYNNLPKLVIKSSEADNEKILFKGWMNQLSFEYNPDTYHVNCTHSVYIRLDSSYLRISYPKSNIPKRAMFNESRPELGFVDQDLYEVSKLVSVELLPEGLSEKRLWIKKYPICLTFSSAKSSSQQEAQTTKASQSSKESPIKKHQPFMNKNGDTVLYLFARTDREKDNWYRRFTKVSQNKLIKFHSPSSTPNIAGLDNDSLESKRAISVDLGSLQMSSSYGSISSIDETDDDDAFAEIKFDKQLNFECYMSQLLCPASPCQSKKMSATKTKTDLIDAKTSTSSAQIADTQNMLWLNVLIGRAFFDFLNEEFWANVVARRIQRKLSKIKLPHFMEELKVTGIKLGSSLPKLNRASDPVIDQQGLWIDIDVSYNGSFQMTLETKLNLARLQRGDSDSLSSDCRERELEDMPIRSHIYDNDEDDTAESSSDDDMPMPDVGFSTSFDESVAAAGGSRGKKFMRIVDKIAQSSYFQTAAKNKYVKRAIEEVSKTPLALTVEVRLLAGTLALNFPPMPTNRLWYGFRKNPNLSIVARPKLGAHAVKLVHIHEWIEKKLVLEFQKVVVMPNMDDLIIPIMQPKNEENKT